jgi:chromosome segregation protein
MLSSDHERYEEEEKKYVSQLQSLDDAIQDIQKKRKEHFTSPSSITHEDVLRALEMIYAKKEAYEVLQTHQLLQDQVYGLFEMVFSLIQKIKATLVAHKKESDPRDSLGDMENLFSQKDALRSQFQSIQTAHGIQKERIGTVHSALQKHTEELATCERDLLYFSSQAGKKKDDMLQKEREALSMALTNTEKTLQDFQHTMHARYTQEKESRTRLVNIQKEMAVHQRGMEHIQQSQNATQLELARIETHQEELIRKIADELHVHDTECVSLLGFATPPQELHVEEARLDIEKYKRALEQIGTIDQEIITEHTATKERYDFLTKQMEDLIAALGNLERAIQELDAIIKEKFNVSLDGINKKFQEYFQTLFRGGNAHIIIQKQEQETVLPRTQEDVEQEKEGVEETDKEDDVSGIDIHATPPGKKLKNMSVLSGGEKALTAISLLCAILSINPSPFVVLDEVDAALDESNAGRLASILQELSRKTQFIVITHNRVTTHIAQVLYGITMGEDGTSRMLSLDIGNIDAIVPAS